MRAKTLHYQDFFDPRSLVNAQADGAVSQGGDATQWGVQSNEEQQKGQPANRRHNRELLRLQASHLADLVPDRLIVQEKTVSVVRRDIFVSFIETLPIRDIGRVVLVNTPIFCGLRVLGKNPAHTLTIKGLKRDEAMQAKQLVEGLLLEEEGAIDVDDWLTIGERREALQEAGKSPEHQDDLRRRGHQ